MHTSIYWYQADKGCHGAFFEFADVMVMMVWCTLGTRVTFRFPHLTSIRLRYKNWCKVQKEGVLMR